MEQRRRGRRKKRVSVFTAENVKYIDHKDINRIKQFTSERGKILPRRVTGNSAKIQRMLTVAVKRARHLALLPYTKD